VAAHLDATGALPSGPGVDQLRQHVGQFTVVGSLAAGVERVSAVGLQIGLSLLVLQVFARGTLRWLWIAMAVHAGTNAVAVLLVKPLGVWPVEILVLAIAAAVLAWATRLAARPR
jgi:uncharacterized membrane protein YhfC